MNRSIRTICICISVLLICSACQNNVPLDFSVEYNPTTDFQYNLEYDDLGLSYITESPDSFYFIDGIYLYYMDKETLSPVPLCKKADCLHDKETDPYKKSSCEAFLGGGDHSIFYYDNAIYMLGLGMKGDNTQSYKKQYVLKKYTTDGTYLEDIYTFPKSPQAIIRHRGIVYYTYQDINTIREGNTNGTYKLMSFSLENKEENELFVDDLVDGTLDKLIAYGKYLYIYRNGRSPDSDPNNQESYREETLAYDLETGTIQSVQATEKGVPSFPIPYENSLLYSYWFYNYQDERNRTVYQVELDGQNPKELFQTKTLSNRIAWDGTYLYEDNRPLVYIAQLEPKREIIIYNHALEECDVISFENVENGPKGIDFSSVNMDALRISDDYIFTKCSGPDHQGSYLICIDKAEIGTGNITPRIIWQKEAQYQREEYILDTQ